jgi:hypothetical protein
LPNENQQTLQFLPDKRGTTPRRSCAKLFYFADSFCATGIFSAFSGTFTKQMENLFFGGS